MSVQKAKPLCTEGASRGLQDLVIKYLPATFDYVLQD